MVVGTAGCGVAGGVGGGVGVGVGCGTTGVKGLGVAEVGTVTLDLPVVDEKGNPAVAFGPKVIGRETNPTDRAAQK